MTLPDTAVAGGQDTARERTVRNLVGALIAGLLIAAVDFAATRASAEYSVPGQLAWLTRLAIHWGLAALPLGVAFDIVERNSASGSPSRLAYAIAVITGASAGALVMAMHGKFIDPAISQIAVGLDLALQDRFLYGLWQLGFWGAVGAVLHSTDNRRRRRVEALRAEEIARLRDEKRLTEARLGALHAQVEPQFLLASLGRIERLYATDAAAADRLLDALIRFLREAIPLLRRQHSTVADEHRLLHEYLGVTGTGASDALIANVDLGSRTVAMPPGLLLSLAQKVIDAAPECEPRFELATTRTGGIVTVDLSATVDPCVPLHALQEATAQACRRLAMSSGAGGSVTILRGAPGRLTLRIALIDHRGD